jgi:hypothetical protein
MMHDASFMMNDASCMFNDASCMFNDASCMFNDASCMVLQNLIHKFEDDLVLTNMLDTCMICAALSKIHDA